MEVDTGAAVSTISVSTRWRVAAGGFPAATLHHVIVLLKTYSGKLLAVIGELQAQVQ